MQADPAYCIIILLSRVITKLGNLDNINPNVIEGLFASDLAYLQDFYNNINGNGAAVIKAVCPKCKNEFEIEPSSRGE